MSESAPIGRTDDLQSSSETDRAAGYGTGRAADQVDVDAQEADVIAARLSSES
jgi:hypothetical protein